MFFVFVLFIIGRSTKHGLHRVMNREVGEGEKSPSHD